MRENRVKRELQAGNVQVGTWINTFGSPQVPQVLAAAGFDYVNVDMEHTAFSIETVGNMCAAALTAGLMPMVRPSGKALHLVSRPLDNGAMAILMPHVDTREQAEETVRSVKFPPVGVRGSHPPNVQTEFAPFDASDYMARSNEESLVLVQIESGEALGNLDAILSVPGVDGATVGRGDLAADLGVPGTDPSLVQAVEDVIATCQRHDKIPGLLVPSPEAAREWIAKGVRLVTYASEGAILRSAAREALQKIRSAT